MLVIVDNTQNLSDAFMTPKIIKFLEEKEINHTIISSYGRLDLPCPFEEVTGVIFSGGPLMLSDQLELIKIQSNIELFIRLLETSPDTPILAICFGYQLVALLYGGEIKSMDQPNTGKSLLNIDTRSILFQGMDSTLEVFNHHEDHLANCPRGFKVIAWDDSCGISGIEHHNRPIWGLQFHPEGLESSQKILDNFLKQVTNDLLHH